MPAALQFRVVFFFDSIHARVHFCATRHGAGDFLAEEEIGIAAKFFHRVDRIVIGNCDEVHAALFQPFVQRARLVVRLLADAGEPGHCTHARVHRVNVEIAPHAPVVNRYPLQNSELRTKQR